MYNKSLKRALRKCLYAHPDLFWDDLLPEIVLGLRCTVSSSHGYTPHEVVFKQTPVIPGMAPVCDEAHVSIA